MKSDWLWIGAAALAAYLYFTKDANASSGGFIGGDMGAPTTAAGNVNSSAKQGNPQATNTNASDLLKLIKNSASTFDQVQGSGIYAITPALKTAGGVSKIYADPNRVASTTGILKLTVNQVAHDSSGLSSFDKIILKNKGLAATAANAAKAGLR